MPACSEHGAVVDRNGLCATDRVLARLREHRAYQYARYGSNADTENGTGPDVHWFPDSPLVASDIEELVKHDWDYSPTAPRSDMTWMRLVREEVAEAFAVSDPASLQTELLDVAALCVSWLETLEARGATE